MSAAIMQEQVNRVLKGEDPFDDAACSPSGRRQRRFGGASSRTSPNP
jgi:hypothetical protein